MPFNFFHGMLLLVGISVFSCSCSSGKKITSTYYYENEKALDKIEESYKKLYSQQAFNIVFTDKYFSILTIEIKTDSLTYIYQFEANESRLQDTLTKYSLDAPRIAELIRQMQSIQCIWINNLDYYVDEEKQSLIFISIKPVAKNLPFAHKKYYILSYFNQPQYFDEEGRLLVKRKLKKIHKINGDIFRRINDHICYTISERYR